MGEKRWKGGGKWGKSGKKLGKVAISGEKWQKVDRSSKTGEKWGKVRKSG